VHGDIEIIPANTPGAWEIAKQDTALLIGISPELLKSAAEQLDLDPGRVEIQNRFHTRDPQIENIGWALKAEMEAGNPSGRLYVDSLAVSVAARVLLGHSSISSELRPGNSRLSGLKLKRVLSYIEDNLAQDLSLQDVASFAGLSVSHLKRLFRESAGMPLHQYLIRRRVERAKSLLIEGRLPISQIAAETGFAHQSHLARHVRRVLGVSPKSVRDDLS